MRRLDERALDHRGRAILVQRGDQRFAHFQFGDGLLHIEIAIDPEGFRRRLDRALVSRSEGAQRVLHAVADLARDLVRNVDRILRHEEHAHALGPDQAHHRLDRVLKGLRRIVEQQVRLVEEEHQLRLVLVAHLGKRLEQLGEQPEQVGRIQLGAAHQPVGGEDIDETAPARIDAKQVVHLQRGFTEEAIRPLAFETQQAALDRADRGLRNAPVLAAHRIGIVGSMGEQTAQVREVEQQQAIIVGVAEYDLQHAFLRIVEVQQARQKQRTHLRNRGAYRMALLPEQVPEDHRKIGVGIVVHAQLRSARLQLIGMLEPGGAGHCETGEVALHVRHEYRHARGGEAFCKTLQRHRLARARRAGDQPVAVGARQQQFLRFALRIAPQKNRAHPPCLPVSMQLCGLGARPLGRQDGSNSRPVR